MPRTVIPVSDVASNSAYSHLVTAGSLLVTAGQVALDADGAVVGKDDPAAQSVQAFENLRRVLAAGGATFDDVVKLTIYVTSRDCRKAVADVRQSLFAEPRPASTYLVVAGLAVPDLLVEVEAIAYLN
jgi:enamine deaminase RidA (YjgF/YER057c/UK114 family)